MLGYCQVMHDADVVRRYLAEIEKVPPLTPAEEAELTRRARAGDDRAKQRLAAANLRLVEPVVVPYADRGVRLIDLIQEGNKELIRAIEDFDAGRDGTLSSYASTRIREVIERIVGQ
jgi:RNA polymerase primary sigma factor